MLRPPKENVTRHRAFDPSFEPPVAVEQYQRASIFTAAPHQRRTKHHVAEANHAAEMMQRNLKLGFSLDANLQGLVIQMQIRIFRRDVKGVQELMHTLLLLYNGT